MRMVQDCIMVEIPEINNVTESGIIMVMPKGVRLCEGTVREVGPGKMNKKGERVAPILKPGDTIIFEHGKGVEVEKDGKKFMIMREPDVAVLTDKLHGNEFDDSPFYMPGAVKA